MGGGWVGGVSGCTAGETDAGPRTSFLSRFLSRRWLWLLAPLFVALVAWGWWRGDLAVRGSRREFADLTARKQRLEAVNRALAREVAALKTEREARARAAREAMDAVAPGEVLVIVPTVAPAKVP